MPENSYGQVCEEAAQYETLCGNQVYRHEKQAADLWTAAFFWPLTPDNAATVPTEDIFRRFQADDYTPDEATRRRLEELATKHLFFHWHLEFPEVFGTSPLPYSLLSGFDCVLGDPPWERIKLQEKEFFAQKDPEIANAPNAAARKKLIVRLVETNLPLYQAFQGELRRADCESGFVRDSGRYPLCGWGDVNTYSIFAELKRDLLNPIGRVGCIVPSEKCRDKTLCDQCYFKTRERMNTELPIDPIKQDPVRISDIAGLTTEVEMKVNQVSVLVSKKIGKNFCSWSLSYGATAEVEDEHFTEVISQLDTQLKELVSTALPTPNGNGNGHGTQTQLPA